MEVVASWRRDLFGFYRGALGSGLYVDIVTYVCGEAARCLRSSL